MPTFQYVSDIHLEDKKKPKSVIIDPIANYLILAGDISRIHRDFHLKNLEKFLEECSKKWKRVIYIPEGLKILKDICIRTNAIFLYKGICQLDGIFIVGDTLWSNITDPNLINYVNDFRNIRDNSI